MNTKATRFITTYELTAIALAVALTAICSWISIPIGEVPITLQTFAVFVITGLLGTKCSVLAIIVYFLLGVVGVPVFAGMSSGFGLTSGYIIGFIFTALVVGLSVRRFGKSPLVLALSMFVGVLVCYAFGTVWFIILYSKSIAPIGIWAALWMCVIPYLIPDCVKIAVAVLIVRRVSPHLISLANR